MRSSTLLSVCVPVANLRRTPVHSAPSHGYEYDDLQETQTLFNEPLLCLDETEDWYYVQAVEQMHFVSEKGWHGYPGWIEKSCAVRVSELRPANAAVRTRIARLFHRTDGDRQADLFVSCGTRFCIDDVGEKYCRAVLNAGETVWLEKGAVAPHGDGGGDRLPRYLMETAKLFVGVPYLWGGRSMFMGVFARVSTGVDCSGLINLIYRTNGIDVPRDAQAQWMVATPVGQCDLRAGDLIFVSREREEGEIHHVMLYTGGEFFLEASETGDSVRTRSFKDKFGQDAKGLADDGFRAGGKKIYFGRIGAKWRVGAACLSLEKALRRKVKT